MAFDIHDKQLTDDTPRDGDTTLGNSAQVRFISIGNKTVDGKVDTGATTSCLHATDITVNKGQNSVSFNSPALSNNMITMDLEGSQDVHSADGDGDARPIVKFDIEINGVPIQNATFNLNDRGHMDSMVLIGQNVLKAGNFQVDVNKDVAPEQEDQVQSSPTAGSEQMQSDSALENEQVRAALQVLAESNVSVADIIKYFRTVAANSITY